MTLSETTADRDEKPVSLPDDFWDALPLLRDAQTEQSLFRGQEIGAHKKPAQAERAFS